MVNEAAQFEEEDKKMREKVEARNSLEGVAYSLKNQINDKEKLGGKLSDDDKQAVEDAVAEAIKFLDENPNAEKEEYEEAKNKLQSVTNPIVSKVYGQGGAPEGGAGGADDEPSVICVTSISFLCSIFFLSSKCFKRVFFPSSKIKICFVLSSSSSFRKNVNFCILKYFLLFLQIFIIRK